MTDLGVRQEGRARRAARAADTRRARRHRRARFAAVVVGLGVVALLAFMDQGASDPGSKVERTRGDHAAAVRRPEERMGYGATIARARVRARFKLPVRSGLLFDVRTGRVLWERHPGSVLPIASLTKMMTALVVATHSRPSERVLVTRAALHYSGSGVGLLPLGKKISLVTMLYGLLLPSGNDAAIALAQHVAGTQARFIAMMNARARAMGLRCSHFTTVSGIVDQGNHSCATDLTIIAHAVLRQPLLARIVGSRSAVLPFPIKGGKLWLYNNNPLLRLGYPGADGVKTGYTLAAGRCLVVAARRGHTWLGVVLLHSADPPDQATELLNAGFATHGA
jgi:serine-type D-Ala-D-Ala carboxypeptidase (penicillin-binding protein 5/6)